MSRWTEQWWDGSTTRIHLPAPFDAWSNFCETERACVVVDESVAKQWADRLPNGPRSMVVRASESAKVMETVTRVHEHLLKLEADRTWTLVAIGGGITTDLAAFAAATYMRGMNLILVPTTLLAQVDAAIGGKTGVNFRRYKNLVGTFYQPGHILVDPTVLHTLPEAQWRNGMAEVIKHACLSDPTWFDELSAMNLSDVRQPGTLEHMLERAIETKLHVVRTDTKESGFRRILNLGHTFGHAIERLEGGTHGEAVAVGLVLAAALSEHLGLAQPGLRQRIETLNRTFGLPVVSPVPVDALVAHMRHDKKRRGDVISFVLLRNIGEPVIRDIPVTELEERMHDLRQPR